MSNQKIYKALILLLIAFGAIDQFAASAQVNCSHQDLPITCYLDHAIQAENEKNDSLAIVYYSYAEQWCLDQKEDSILLVVYSNKLFLLANSGEYNTAITVGHQMIDMAMELNDTFKLASAHNNLGWIYYSQGNYTQSVSNYKEAKTLYKSKYPFEYATLLLNLGIVYKNINFPEEAIELLQESAVRFQDLEKPMQQASCLNSIGNLHLTQKNHKRAIEYHLKALKIRQEIKHEKGIAGSYNNLGNVHKDLNQYDQAIQFYVKSLVIKNQLKNDLLIASTENNLGEVYLQLRDFKKAEEHLLKAYKLRKGKSLTGTLHSLVALSELYLLMGNSNQTLPTLKRAEELSLKIKDDQQRAIIYTLFIEYLTNRNAYSEALTYSGRLNVLNDSLYSREKSRALLELDVRYDSEQKERDIKWLESIKQEQGKTLALRGVLLWIATLFLLILIGLAYWLYKIYRKQKKLKDEQMQLLSDLHHRIRNNLQRLAGLFSLQIATSASDEAKHTLITGKSRVLAMNLLHQQLTFKGNQPSIELSNYTRTLAESVLGAYGRDTDLGLDVSFEALQLDSEQAIYIGLIISELLTNVIKHVKISPVNVSITGEVRSDHYFIIFRDNGSGFDWEKKEGKSFGLRLILMQIKQLKGKLIAYKSGNEFSFEFKIEKG